MKMVKELLLLCIVLKPMLAYTTTDTLPYALRYDRGYSGDDYANRRAFLENEKQ